MKTQKEQILEALERGRPLTPFQALERFGCMRLAARIAELREEGHNIATIWHKTKTGKTVAAYKLRKETT